MKVIVNNDGSVLVHLNEHFGEWYPNLNALRAAYSSDVDVEEVAKRIALREAVKELGRTGSISPRERRVVVTAQEDIRG